MTLRIYGVDFTSAPSATKPITCASGQVVGETLVIDAVQGWDDFCGFEALLKSDGPWLMACDFPFALPREFTAAMGWPNNWPGCMARIATLSRAQFVALVSAFKLPRPAGQKDIKRTIDRAARAISPLNVTRPPVGLMFFEGATRLAASDVSIVPQRPTSSDRIVVEGYPALVAQNLIGSRHYKDGPPDQCDQRRGRREGLIAALSGAIAFDIYGVTVRLPADRIDHLITEPKADHLDAILCALQAAWAVRRGLDDRVPAGASDGWIFDPVINAASLTG